MAGKEKKRKEKKKHETTPTRNPIMQHQNLGRFWNKKSNPQPIYYFLFFFFFILLLIQVASSSHSHRRLHENTWDWLFECHAHWCYTHMKMISHAASYLHDATIESIKICSDYFYPFRAHLISITWHFKWIRRIAMILTLLHCLVTCHIDMTPVCETHG